MQPNDTMSQVYSTEPATSGHVILDTSHGPIDIHLWCKECPSTTRTFIQLCLDGYYDGMIFHRIFSDFLVQAGLTTDGKLLSNSGGGGTVGNGNNAASIDRYLRSSTASLSGGTSSNSLSVGGGGDALGLDRKKLEVNPRIRFNHRGQVAMAFPLEVNDAQNDDEETAMLRYQFFITLDEAPFLDAKHVLFGTVAGPTMFNALRIGRTDADEKSGIPVDIMDDPPRIKSVKVNYHPFDDLVATSEEKIPWKKKASEGGGDAKQQSAMEIRRKKRKGKRDYNVLSFGDEEREYAEELNAADEGKGGHKKKKGGAMLGSHDVLSASQNATHQKPIASDDGHTLDDRSNKLNAVIKEESHGNGVKGREELTGSASKHLSYQVPPGRISNLACDNTTNDDRDQKKGESAKAGGISAVEARRAKYLKSGSGSSANKKERLNREGDTMARLFAFKNKVIETTKGRDTHEDVDFKATKHVTDNSLASRMAERANRTKEEEVHLQEEEDAFKALPGYTGQVIDEGKSGIEDNISWIGTKFNCRRHIDNDSRMTAMDQIDESRVGGDGRRMDDYVVLDEKRSRRGRERNEEAHQNQKRYYGDGNRLHR